MLVESACHHFPIQNVIKGEVQIRYRKIKTAGVVTIGEKAALRDTFIFGKKHQRVGRFHVLLVMDTKNKKLQTMYANKALPKLELQTLQTRASNSKNFNKD